MSELGVGIVGAGGIFEQHASALAELSDRARIVALCDVDQRRLDGAAARHGIEVTCRAHDELVGRADVDVVVVCTPPSLHEQVVVGAVAAGKHVICEKPLAHTLQSADRIIDTVRTLPGSLSVVYQFRYLPDVRRALWLRDRGVLGSLLSGRFYRFARFRRPGKPLRAPWWGRWEMAGGGTVMTQLIHELDLMCLLFGSPERVWAVVDTLNEAIESEDVCAATVQFPGGALCSCQSTMSAHRSIAGFDVFARYGSVHSPWSFECLDRERRAALRLEALEAVPAGTPVATSNAHVPYLASVLDAILEGRPLPSGAEQARPSLELATAIYASSLDGGEGVKLPLGPGHPLYAGVDGAQYRARTAAARGLSVVR
ncbi:MAG TPA: Gfo/Idh/MocA family oxidoreductase [Solirubrobacteraceae bacterium]|nr:Gfo/Idh/MocA family oxidoreductase [Solirubrobacteraceae bacterium]